MRYLAHRYRLYCLLAFVVVVQHDRIHLLSIKGIVILSDQISTHPKQSQQEKAMLKITKKVVDRLSSNLKKYQQIAESHRDKAASEADTVTLVKDMLCDCFGFDNYEELPSEQRIRGTYCGLAGKIDGKIKYLIEVKAAGVGLNDLHLLQALSYGSKQDIEWIVLTNAVEWRLYRIKFDQPVDYEEVSSFNLLEVNPQKEDDMNKMFLLCREGISSAAMDDYLQHTQVLNRYTVAQVLLTNTVVSSVRKEIRKLYPDQKIDNGQIIDILNNEVLKRDVIEGEKAKETQQKLNEITAKRLKQTEKKIEESETLTIIELAESKVEQNLVNSSSDID